MKKNKIAILIVFAVIIIAGSSWIWEGNRTIKNKEQYKIENGNVIKEHAVVGDNLFPLGDRYAYFGNDAFFNGKKMDGANGSELESLSGGYARDRKNVFYEGNLLEGADVKTFREYKEFSPIFIDKNQAYYAGEAMTFSEAEELNGFLTEDIGGTDLGNNYRLYKENIYYWIDGGGQAVPSMSYLNINLEKYEIIDTGCIWDKNKYRFNVCTSYIKDNEKVFWNNYELKGADPETFVIVNYEIELAKDRNNFYLGTRKISEKEFNEYDN